MREIHIGSGSTVYTVEYYSSHVDSCVLPGRNFPYSMTEDSVPAYLVAKYSINGVLKPPTGGSWETSISSSSDSYPEPSD